MSRSLCPDCQRPLASCYCDLCLQIDNRALLTLLQHPKEANHPKGSAGLLLKSLTRSECFVGEHFEASLMHDDKQPLLLFPADADKAEFGPPTLSAQDLNPDDVQLLVLDGTWRKTRRLMHENPWLQQLPRLTLETLPSSGYHIRKAEKDGQLSTLEASCQALIELENNPQKYRPLLASFDTLVSRFQAFMPTSPQQ